MQEINEWKRWKEGMMKGNNEKCDKKKEWIRWQNKEKGVN